MIYEIIQSPFTLKFPEMSKKELKDYFTWLQNILPQRLDELTRAVNQSPGFEDWQPNFTPDSLGPLGNWFAANVETRPRTKDEIKIIEAGSAYPMEVPTQELTNRTFSLAMD